MDEVTYGQASEVLRSRLGDTSFAHSERVAGTAADLAVAYGVDSDQARLAGLLHDWDRELSAKELTASAHASGINVTQADESMPYLLHARTAAVNLEQALPGLPPEVLRAVARHTMGAPDMTELDMVVYLADMIEPARSYPGVQGLRDAVGSVTLRELFALGYQHSLAHLVSARRYIHPLTVAVWNELVAGGAR